MKTRKFPLLPVLGICLVLVSICLLFVFQYRLRTGAQHSKQILQRIEAILPERTAGIPEIHPVANMPILELEGTDYVAVVEIPALGIHLPVADEWDSERLYLAPARFSGSAYDGTLVIGGMDDPQQFGFCDKIQYGTQVVITDMTGAQFSYTVSQVNRAKHAEGQWLSDADWDLTLFCHDLYTMEYIAVRCKLA